MMRQGGALRQIADSLWSGLTNLVRDSRSLTYSLLVHVAFIAVFVLSFDWSPTPSAPQPDVDIVEAVVVDEEKVQQELEKLERQEAREREQSAERERRAREQARKAEEARKREEQRLAALKEEQREAERQLAEERKQREEEKRRARELERKQKAEAERLEALRKQQEEIERKKKEEAERLAQLKKEQEALERQRREEEERRKREEERRKKEEERRRELEKQLAAEEQRLAVEREARIQSEVQRYVEIIKQKVARNWIKPPKWEGLKCTVRVNLMPGGEVLNVQITKGSGNSIFDTSVERAVRKASPLPLPADRSLFDRFRELKFVFDPES